MAQSYQLISAQTLTSNASSITFSNIPQNYTDLRILFSARVNTSGGYSNVKIGFNGSTSNITWKGAYAYSGTLYGSNTGSTERIAGNANATSSTSSTFSNVDVYIANYTSTTYAKRISGDSVVESNDNTNPLLSIETVYWNPATQVAITSIELTNSANPAADFLSGSTFYLYGMGGARASGGTITADGSYTYHTFTSTGTFTTAEKIRGAEALVIAGGGGGGRRHGGGGGAGGLSYLNYLNINAGTTYTVIVGGGGAGATVAGVGSTGVNSSFGSIISNGGGAGLQTGTKSVGNGGSGGGSSDYGTSATIGGSATQGNTGGAIGYGNNGGGGKDNGSNSLSSGGGGGAGAVGQTAPSTTQPGAGGDGLNTWSSWATATSTGVNGYYAGGGGGSSFNQSTFGAGGAGGGGAGSSTSTATSGTANTGSGGGGQGDDNANAGSGGSGLIIIRYPNS